MNTNEYLQKHKVLEEISGYTYRRLSPQMVCNDGFAMSVQVSHSHYCSPRVDDAEYYSEVEVGYPSKEEELLMPFAEDASNPTQTVYGYVDVRVVDAVINKHGGLKL